MSSSDPQPAGTGGRPEGVAAADGRLEHLFDGDGLYGLRATISAHAPRLELSAEQTEHLLIVAGELATNAIRHGGGGGRLRLWRMQDSLFCQVSDTGPGIDDPRVGSSPPDQECTGGRGVWICRQLCAALLIERAVPAPGAVVTAVIDLTAQG